MKYNMTYELNTVYSVYFLLVKQKLLFKATQRLCLWSVAVTARGESESEEGN